MTLEQWAEFQKWWTEYQEWVQKVNVQQKAIARAVTQLADGLSSAERKHRSAEDSVRDGLADLLTVLDQARISFNPSTLTAEDIADNVSHAVICKARDIQWKRGEANQLPAPLPPAPDEKKDDDSIVFHTQDGAAHIRANVKAKTLLGWIVGLAMSALYLIEKLTGK